MHQKFLKVFAFVLTFACLLSGTVFAAGSVKRGDVNIDGDINNEDLILLARYVVGAEELTDAQFENADMNNDSAATNADVIKLARIIVGLDKELPDFDGDLRPNETPIC